MFPFAVRLEYAESKRTSTTRTGNMSVGTLGVTPAGDVFRYCQAAAIQIAAGLFLVGESVPVNEQTVTVAHAIGVETVTVTAAGVSVDDYKDGILVVTAGTGAGEVHRIKSNTASDTTIQITFYPGDGLKIAWATADTDVDIFTALHAALVIAPTDGQQLAVALSQGIIPASAFFWGLAKGYGAFMCDVPAAGGLELDEKNIVQSLNHAGQGYIDSVPDADAVLAGYRQNLGFLVTEEDCVDNEMELGKIDLA